VDRRLFVLVMVEVMHTVRVSFQLGSLVCEAFPIIGVIAAIRRALVISLETSQAHQAGKRRADNQAMLHRALPELTVLGGLILVMVISIYLLGRSDQERRA
jgi:hypothetical protein